MLYDGGCPLCSKEVAHYRRADKAQKIRWSDINADPTLLEEHRIPYEAAMKHLHVVDTDGSIVTGAPAFAIVWAELPYYRHLARVVSLPGVLALLDKLYNCFAEKRFARRMACASSQDDK